MIDGLVVVDEILFVLVVVGGAWWCSSLALHSCHPFG